ncbi:MAG: hypothetical protein J0L62_12490 [Bacteroidetes bacterium]|nr:hypothetical protein [Bacteroidota bacterium]
MTSKYYTLLLVMLTFLTVGCSEEKEDTEEAILSGKVTDASGNPIVGAKIFYKFYSVESSVAKLAKPNPSTNISFSIPVSEPITVTLHQYYTNNLLATLYSGTPETGNLSIATSTDNFRISTGLYNYKVTGKTIFYNGTFSNEILDSEQLNESTPLASSDSKGEFSILIPVLGIGYTTNRVNEKGEVIGTRKIKDTIDLIVYTPGKPVQTKSVTIDTKKSSQVTFQF